MKELTLRPKTLDWRKSEGYYLQEISDIINKLEIKKTEIRPKEPKSIDIYLKIEDKEIPLQELYIKLTKNYNIMVIDDILKEGVVKWLYKKLF